MKRKLVYSVVIALAMLAMACDENEIMPSFTTKGTATHTLADISASTTTPAPSQTVTMTVSYVNPSADPLNEIVIKAKVGAGEYVEIQTYSVGSEEEDKTITKTFDYVAPATVGTTVVFDMVISSQKPYPQVQRTQFKTK